MLRLLFLCLIVTLRAAAVSSEENEGSADVTDGDDEDLVKQNLIPNLQDHVDIEPETGHTVDTDKATGDKAGEDGFATIVIIVVVSVVALSIAVIVAIVLVRRRMHNQQQGIYSVPVEQGLKGTV